jgi:hypothetical protein
VSGPLKSGFLKYGSVFARPQDRKSRQKQVDIAGRTVNGFLPACENNRYGALNSVDDDGDLPAVHAICAAIYLLSQDNFTTRLALRPEMPAETNGIGDSHAWHVNSQTD